MATDRPTRRTQAERTTRTQTALLEATIACLSEVGYARLTTRQVADRANVSRGAQNHHYPNRDDLVVAAVGHLFGEQTRAFEEQFADLPVDERTLDNGLELLWDIVSGPDYAAVLEVVVAARTRPDLRSVITTLTAQLETTVLDLLGSLMPAVDHEVARALIDAGFALVQGAAVSTYSGFGDPARTIRLARAMARLLNAQTLPLVRGLLDTAG